MRLLDAIDQYAISRDVRESTLKGYRLAVRRFGAWLGRDAIASDLEPERINRWLYELRRSHLSSYSVQTYRRCLLVVAAWIGARGHAIRIDSSDVTLVRCPPTKRDVWSPEEVRRLIAAVDRLPDDMLRPRVRRRAWWRSLLLAAWDSALRWSDLSRLALRDISPDGAVELTQWKTLVSHVVQFSPETLDAIGATYRGVGVDVERAVIWPVPYATWRHRELSQLLGFAGLEGNLQKLRRSAITAAEIERSGKGTLLAGHTNPATTHRWYLSRARMLEERPAAPPLFGSETMLDLPSDGRQHWSHAVKRHERIRIGTPAGTIEIAADKDDRGRPKITVVTEPDAPITLEVVRA